MNEDEDEAMYEEDDDEDDAEDAPSDDEESSKQTKSSRGRRSKTAPAKQKTRKEASVSKTKEVSLETFKQGLEAGAALKALEKILARIENKAGDKYPPALKTEAGRSVLLAALPVILDGISAHAGPAEDAVRKMAGLCETAHLAIGVRYGAHLAEIVGSLLEGIAE